MEPTATTVEPAALKATPFQALSEPAFMEAPLGFESTPVKRTEALVVKAVLLESMATELFALKRWAMKTALHEAFLL
ncbi:MAG: hypothetical protein AAFQ67_08595 [Pseudomonadota bacterium]